MFRNPLVDAAVVLVVVLLIFGPKRLPMLGRSLGQGMREFKDSITGSSKHDDGLSVADHLDELRSRLFWCLAVLISAFGVCFWQNHALLDILNRALPHVSSQSAQRGLASLPNRSVKERAALLRTASAFQTLASAPTTAPSARAAYEQAAAALTESATQLPTTATP